MKLKSIFIALMMLNTIGLFAQDAKEISKKSADIVDIGNMEMISTIHIYDASGNQRIRQITTASKTFGDVTKTMVRFISPADVKGTTFLIYDYETKDDNMWIYMPALRKVRRIVSSERGKNFMGSEFTNADMSKPNLDDYDYSIVGSADVDGKSCWKIESKCKTKAIENSDGYSKRISYIDKNLSLCYKVEYYDLFGKLHRIETITDYKKQPNGKYFAFHMSMKNVQNGRKSVIDIDKFQAGSKLPESAFSPSMLQK